MPQASPTTPPATKSLLRRVFASLDEAGVTFCVLRDGESVAALERGGEIDLLVAGRDGSRLPRLLGALGFVRLRAWGHSPHRFFVAYDADADVWLKLDVVDAVAFGRPTPALRTTLAARCLANRRRSGDAFVPSVEDELVTLLLHCVLDKSEIAPERGRRLQELSDRLTDEAYVTELLHEAGLAREDWPRLARSIRRAEWTMLQEKRFDMEARLKRGTESRVLARRARDLVLRKANLAWGIFRPRALCVALLAPDGAGKSTLADGVRQGMLLPVRLIYMGLYQKSPEGEGRVRGLGFAGRLLRQWRRYLSARLHAARGHFVIFDRYGLDARLDPGREISWHARARRWLLSHACPPPDLVFLLDAPGDALFARKGEHGPEKLEAQRQGYLQLLEGIPRGRVVDATRNSDEVRRDVTRSIWSTFIARSGMHR